MPFLAIGVEHKTAPLAVRERLTLSDDALQTLSAALAAEAAIDEAVILTTCNRVEVYLFGEDCQEMAALARSHLLQRDDSLLPYLHTWEERDAAEHLFRVASGLESQLLGEGQILSQVREAFDLAQRLGTVGPNLHTLFRSAISCARQARAGSTLGRVNVSLGAEAVRAAEAELGDLEGRSALLVGGGEIIRLVAQELRRRKAGTLFIANRTDSVAVDLAAHYGGRAASLKDVARIVPHVDLMVTATSAPRYVLTPEDIGRTGRPLCIYDLAIPRDVDPEVGSIPAVALHDLESLLPSGPDTQWDDVRQMEGVIAAEVQEFMAWYLTRRVAPVIAHLRSHVEAVSEQELKRVAPQLANLTERERAAVESLTGRLIDKMFHHLVVRLRLAAQTDPSLVDAAEFFFLHGEGGLFEHASQTGSATETDART